MKKKTCVKLNNNTFVVLPGIKSKLDLLKNELTKKANQFRKNSEPSVHVIASNNLPTTTLSTENCLTPSTESNPTIAHNSSSSIRIPKPEEKIKQDLIRSIDDWCKKENGNKDQQIIQLIDSVDYDIIIDVNLNKTLIKCECGSISTLGQKDKHFIVSHCFKRLQSVVRNADGYLVHLVFENKML